MKKSTLFLACCIGLMLFASCKKDIKPTITIATDPAYVSPNAQVYSGNPITVGFNVTGENLVQIMMVAEQNGVALFTHSETLDNTASYSYAKTFVVSASGDVTIRGTVTDAKGETGVESFVVHFNEKPNEKFVGRYEGDILITGNVNINIIGMDPMNDVLDNRPFPAVVTIEPGEDIDEVIAIVTIDEQSNTVTGTVEGNKVVFEAINDTFVYNVPFQGITFAIPLNMTYTINGLLNGDQLDLDGSCAGDGEIHLVIYNGTIDMEGTIDGSLKKL